MTKHPRKSNLMIKLLTPLVLTLMIFSLPTRNSNAATPEELAKACDLALTAKVQEASLCGLGVQLRQNELDRVTKENTQLREESGAWYKNPVVFAALGVIAGAFIGAKATR